MAAFEQLVLVKKGANHDIEGVDISYVGANVSIHLTKNINLKIVYHDNWNVQIRAHQGVQAQLFHDIKETVSNMDFQMELAHASQVRQLVLHDSTSLHISEQYQLKRNTLLRCAFGELSAGSSVHEAHYRLMGQGSDMEATYVYMNEGESNKKNTITVHHEAGHSQANIENYGVAAGKSRLIIDVDSKIAKGAIQSKTHQTSRILTFEEGVYAKVTPSLFIDENDVEASHACSMGVIDENHLYYLQSRGLTRGQAVYLIVSGYLSPLAKIFEGDELREEVSHMIDTKAGEYIGHEDHS